MKLSAIGQYVVEDLRGQPDGLFLQIGMIALMWQRIFVEYQNSELSRGG